jgi:hypothetical protein
MDLGFVGPKLTWTNRQGCDTNVKCCLVWGVANGAFSHLFEDCLVENITTISSDHYAILVSLTRSSRVTMQKPVQHGFWFEAMWLRDLYYREMLEKELSTGRVGHVSLQSTWANLSPIAVSLKDWRRATSGSVWNKIRQLKSTLHDIREGGLLEILLQKEKEVEAELYELFEREEIMAR